MKVLMRLILQPFDAWLGLAGILTGLNILLNPAAEVATIPVSDFGYPAAVWGLVYLLGGFTMFTSAAAGKANLQVAGMVLMSTGVCMSLLVIMFELPYGNAITTIIMYIAVILALAARSFVLIAASRGIKRND